MQNLIFKLAPRGLCFGSTDLVGVTLGWHSVSRNHAGGLFNGGSNYHRGGGSCLGLAVKVNFNASLLGFGWQFGVYCTFFQLVIFDLLVFDDVVTWMSVSTPEQNAKTYQRWQDALNTGTGDGTRHRIIGTFYALRDTYFNILNPKAESGVMGGSRYTLRKYPAMEPDGNTVLYSKEYIEFQREMMVGLVFSSQIMCDPQDASSFKFLEISIVCIKHLVVVH